MVESFWMKNPKYKRDQSIYRRPFTNVFEFFMGSGGFDEDLEWKLYCLWGFKVWRIRCFNLFNNQ